MVQVTHGSLFFYRQSSLLLRAVYKNTFLIHLFSALYILVMSWCRFYYYFCFNLSFLNCIFHIVSRDLFHIVYVIGYLRGVFLGHDPLLLRIVSPSLRGKPCLLCNSL